MSATELFTQYTQVPAQNNMAVPVGWPTGMNPSDVEPTAREMLATICNLGLMSGAFTFSDTGSANVITIATGIPGGVTLQTGHKYRVLILNNNSTTNPTVTVDSNAAKTVVYNNQAAIAAGELQAGTIREFLYDGTQMRLTSANNNFPSGFRGETAGFTAPTGWYIENGAAYNRITDAPLFNALTVAGTFSGTNGQSTITFSAAPGYTPATLAAVTYSGASGSNVLTTVSGAPTNPLGQPFTGPGVPANTLITGYDPINATLTLSNTLTAAETTVTGYLGTAWQIDGTNIPVGAYIISYNSGTLTATLSAALTGNVSGQAYVMGPYGLGDHSTTFNVPNTIDRVIVGAGNFLSVGQIAGEQMHTQNITEMPNHAHGYDLGAPVGTNFGSAYFAQQYNPSPSATTSTGGGMAMNNAQPSMGGLRIIKR